jgi:glycosyltransferase involved in cell wall biosynthesis
MILLSILTPTIPKRRKMFNALYTKLYVQQAKMKEVFPEATVELQYDDSKPYLQGGLSIGKKRESLVQWANGKYLCFLDDDEDIAPNYLETLIILCLKDKDICTFRNISKLGNHYWTIIDMSLSHPVNEDATPETIVKRRPWHMCPVRSEYAKKYEFPNISYGEDWAWFEKVLTHCKTEARSLRVIHEYRQGEHSEADKITQHEQSKIS